MQQERCVVAYVIIMRHRNAPPRVSITEEACYRTERILMRCTDSPSKGGWSTPSVFLELTKNDVEESSISLAFKLLVQVIPVKVHQGVDVHLGAHPRTLLLQLAADIYYPAWERHGGVLSTLSSLNTDACSRNL